MKFFREKKVVEFDDKKVELYEINVKTLIKIETHQYNSIEEIIADNSNLTLKELENASIEAIKLLEKEFLELNKQHLDTEDKTKEKADKKKS